MLVEQKRTSYSKAEELTAEKLDLDQFLSLTLIRQHTRTDDVPTIPDEQLVLYRKAALESAEKYTGLLLQERRVITEAVALPNNHWKRRRPWFIHRTKKPFAQPIAYYYGHRNEPPVQIPVIVGDRTVKLPYIVDALGLGCCNPCAQPAQARLMYVAGFGCEADVPSAIALGALKYIAHVIENPGDIAYSYTGSGRASDEAALHLTANPAYASGAIEIWRSCVDDAI